MKASGADTRRVLLDFGFAEQEIETLIAAHAVSLS
jgi:hypothetical protein